MRFAGPLIRARLIKRYKRFLADAELPGGDVITAHCANPGAMTGLNHPGSTIYLSKSDNPKRKLAYSWELSETGDGLVGINTAAPNRIVREALEAAAIPALTGYDRIRPEVKYGERSRVDFLLEGAGRPDCYVEVKNVHLFRAPGLAEFPDSVTARGARHLRDLSAMRAAGCRAVMLFLVQRASCRRFQIAADIDPAYAAALAQATAAGVEVLVHTCQISLEGIAIGGSAPYIAMKTPATGQHKRAAKTP